MRPDELIGIVQPKGYSSPTSFWECDVFLELCFWAVVALTSLGLLILRPAVLGKVENFWKRFSRNRGWAVACTIFSALLLRAALLPILPIPDPVVHDEYSYLLGAQTFADGRLTNPTPPMWEHFETFHVNMWPTYQSMYPPGQSLLMAVPILLHLDPWWGVWLSVGLMCGAICWMLQAWMSPQWALLGGMFCVLRFSTFSYWIDSYWGGALAAIGGALVLGAFPRLMRSRKMRYAAWFALGLCILANTRPYEGAVFSLPAILLICVSCLVAWLGGARIRGWWSRASAWLGVPRADASAFGQSGERIAWLKTAAVAGGLLGVTVAAMAFYNWKGTGNPTLMPYVENQYQYHITKPFIWQSRYPIPNYHHQVMRTLYVFREFPDYLNRRYPAGLWRMYQPRVQTFYDFFLWPLLGLLAITLPPIARSKRMRLLALSSLALVIGLAVEEWPLNAHYAAPLTGALIALLIYSLRILRLWKPRGLPAGRMMVRSVVALCAIWTVVALAPFALNPYRLGMFQDMPAVLDRCRLTAELDGVPGQHVVIVHNRRSTFGMFDWVYNDPDMEHAKVIWARDMGPKANQELIHFYAGRHFWFVDQDDGIMRMVPYSDEAENDEPTRILNVATNQPVEHSR